MMMYKGYRAKVELDYEGQVFHGEVVNTRDVIYFEGTSVEELNREFRFSIDDYLAMCEERGEEPDKPFSGKIALRMRPELHRAAATAAQAEGKSLNAWLSDTIESSVGQAN
jgi:predicted HicB family RNase H-like nuclease